MRRVVHFLVHVPKCAGTTVQGHLRRHLNDDYLMAPRLHGLKGIARNFYGPHASLDGIEPERLSRLKALAGHSLSVSLKRHFADCEIRQAVMLRDPLGYFASLYNYRVAQHRDFGYAHPPPFDVWYRGVRKNPVSRFILTHYLEIGHPRIYRYSSAARLALLERELAGFHFVGSYRHCDEMVAGISRELGISTEAERRNVSPPASLSPDMLPRMTRQRILEDNALDQALYERWKDRKWRGAPAAPAPALPATDHAVYLASDIGNLFHRRWRWRGNTGRKRRREAEKLAGAGR